MSNSNMYGSFYLKNGFLPSASFSQKVRISQNDSLIKTHVEAISVTNNWILELIQFRTNLVDSFIIYAESRVSNFENKVIIDSHCHDLPLSLNKIPVRKTVRVQSYLDNVLLLDTVKKLVQLQALDVNKYLPESRNLNIQVFEIGEILNVPDYKLPKSITKSRFIEHSQTQISYSQRISNVDSFVLGRPTNYYIMGVQSTLNLAGIPLNIGYNYSNIRDLGFGLTGINLSADVQSFDQGLKSSYKQYKEQIENNFNTNNNYLINNDKFIETLDAQLDEKKDELLRYETDLTSYFDELKTQATIKAEKELETIENNLRDSLNNLIAENRDSLNGLIDAKQDSIKFDSLESSFQNLVDTVTNDSLYDNILEAKHELVTKYEETKSKIEELESKIESLKKINERIESNNQLLKKEYENLAEIDPKELLRNKSKHLPKHGVLQILTRLSEFNTGLHTQNLTTKPGDDFILNGLSIGANLGNYELIALKGIIINPIDQFRVSSNAFSIDSSTFHSDKSISALKINKTVKSTRFQVHYAQIRERNEFNTLYGSNNALGISIENELKNNGRILFHSQTIITPSDFNSLSDLPDEGLVNVTSLYNRSNFDIIYSQRIDRMRLNFSAEYTYQGAQYNSQLYFFIPQQIQKTRLRITKSFRNYFFLNGFYQITDINNSSFTNEGFGVIATFKYKKSPSLNFSHTPFTSNSNIESTGFTGIDNQINNTSLDCSYDYKIIGLNSRSRISFMKSEFFLDNNTSQINSFSNIGFYQSFSFNSKFFIRSSIANQIITAVSETRSDYNYQIEFGSNFKGIKTTLNYRNEYSRIFQSRLERFSLSSSYAFKEYLQLNLITGYTDFIDGIESTALPNEFFVSINATFSLR
ncbi:MAG: hypothetical protein JXQ87_17295 [Bacteroidia bacterium]